MNSESDDFFCPACLLTISWRKIVIIHYYHFLEVIEQRLFLSSLFVDNILEKNIHYSLLSFSWLWRKNIYYCQFIGFDQTHHQLHICYRSKKAFWNKLNTIHLYFSVSIFIFGKMHQKKNNEKHCKTIIQTSLIQRYLNSVSNRKSYVKSAPPLAWSLRIDYINWSDKK